MKSGSFVVSAPSLFALLMVVILGTALITTPQAITAIVGRPSWLVPPLAMLVGFAVLGVLYALNRRCPGKNLIQIAELAWGRWLGKAAGLAFVAFTIYLAGSVAFEKQNFEITAILPTTPAWLVALLAAAVETYLAWLGIAAIAVICILGVLLYVFTFFSVHIVGINHLPYHQLLPLLGFRPPKVLLEGAAVLGGWYGEVVFVTFLTAGLKNVSLSARYALAALGFVTFALMIDLATVTALLDQATGGYTYPLYSLSRYASVGSFARIDPFVQSLWMSLSVLKVAALVYFASVGLAQTLGLRNYRAVLPPVMVAARVLGLVFYRDAPTIGAHFTTAWPTISGLFELVLPLALLATVLARGVRAEPA
ncbi:MAG TPA: GerAB/ArcD/ProY family transporter [Limnochordia bacterium]|nr:GerAB/ArcD/ProY family transporter [Limnochordia bacterium]